ncbi:hypothetical protein, partial [Streptomyces sp. NPDC059616]|uniref:hypothetical protein n=1 Tax=Streptomyces sp. NPDC059616 TaxID=3346886 RepID=UPI00369A9B54
PRPCPGFSPAAGEQGSCDVPSGAPGDAEREKPARAVVADALPGRTSSEGTVRVPAGGGAG